MDVAHKWSQVCMRMSLSTQLLAVSLVRSATQHIPYMYRLFTFTAERDTFHTAINDKRSPEIDRLLLCKNLKIKY